MLCVHETAWIPRASDGFLAQPVNPSPPMLPMRMVCWLVTMVVGCTPHQDDTPSDAGSGDASDTTDAGDEVLPGVTILGEPLDAGRFITMDGANFVTTATSRRNVELAEARLYTEYATIAVYDSNFTQLAMQHFGNATGAVDGSTSILLNGVVDNGYYYFAGKSNVVGTDLCPLDGLPALSAAVDRPYVFKYHLDDNTLVLDACMRIDFLNSNGAGAAGEISGMAIGSGRLFIGGSTRGTQIVLDTAGTSLAIKDAVGQNDPNMSVGTLFNADAYIASFDLDLRDLAVLKYGTADWEEILDLQYDESEQMIYTAGSTHGDLCTAYTMGALFPTNASVSTTTCTTGPKNKSSASNRNAVTFDAYVGAFQWKPDAQERLQPRALRQFGVKDEDTFNGLAFFRDTAGLIGGGTHLYFAGKYTAPGAADMDARIIRMSVSGAGAIPDDIFSNTIQTYVRGVAGTTEAAGEIAVTPTAIFVAGARNGAPRTHAGPCGAGADSQLIPVIERFDHAPTLALGAAYEYVAPTPLHRTAEVRGITIDAAANRFVSVGASTYATTAYCGDPTSQAYIDNANAGGEDDNMHRLDATLFHHPL
jgi:hypothetical protein